MKMLVLAEHNNQQLNQATLHTLSAAHQLAETIDVIVTGANCKVVAMAAAAIPIVERVLVIDSPHLQHQGPENVAATVATIAKQYTHIFAPATTFGKNILPRLAALLDVGMAADIIKIIDATTFVRPIYAGNAIATIKSHDPIKCITVRTTAFELAKTEGGNAAIIALESAPDLSLSQFIQLQSSDGDRPDLMNARVVISGGRGLGSAENFKLIEQLADRLNAAIGASRAAVDAGFVPNDFQVGQTGKVVAPDLYIAIGISGAIQHLAGMKDSKVIVAINQDADAPIFAIADYGLVGDLFNIIPEFIKALGN